MEIKSRAVPHAPPVFFGRLTRPVETGIMHGAGYHHEPDKHEDDSFFFEQGKKTHVLCFAGHKPNLLDGVIEHIFHVTDDFVFLH